MMLGGAALSGFVFGRTEAHIVEALTKAEEVDSNG